jgi:hypothetical protein
MEQVFGLVNVVLRRDRQTRKRTLSVRDYKVIPLASQAGVLEFVGNTTPLRDWLYYAHSKYVFLLQYLLSLYLCRPLDIDQVTLSLPTLTINWQRCAVSVVDKWSLS